MAGSGAMEITHDRGATVQRARRAVRRRHHRLRDSGNLFTRNVEVAVMKEVLIARFMDKTMPEPNSGCWLWTGAVDRNTGYGFFAMSKAGPRLAHRVAYVLFKAAEIPDGFQIDHLCRVRHCVNPDHLEPVTVAENLRRAREANGPAAQCKRGHSMADCIVDKGGVRRCRVCRTKNRTDALARRKS